jgi:hypothetical protein
MTHQSNFGEYPTGVFYPFRCDITAVSSVGDSILVTTSVDHMFVVGNQVSFSIPQAYGMRQLSGKTGYVTAVPDVDQIVVNINAVEFNAFVTPMAAFDPAQVMPIGDTNFGTLSPGGIPANPNTIPGAYNVTQTPDI